MDNFAVVNMVMGLVLLFLGEARKDILYLGISIPFLGALALRMGDELFYVATGFLIVSVTLRMYKIAAGAGAVDDEYDEYESEYE